jgi:hypothetical protein
MAAKAVPRLAPVMAAMAALAVLAVSELALRRQER